MASSRVLAGAFRTLAGATVIALVAYGAGPTARAAQPPSATVSTSSDTRQATAGFRVTTSNPVTAFGGVTMTTPAASAQGVTYTFEFTASKTGTLVPGASTITLSGPATMGFFAAAATSGNATFDDLTSGTSVTERYFTNDPVNSNGRGPAT